MSDETIQAEQDHKRIDLGHHALVLVVISLIVLVGNTVGPGQELVPGLIGLIVLYVIVMAGLAVTKYVPLRLPSVAWISLLGIIVTLPFVPGSAWVVAQVSNVDFLALATPCLAYAGIAIARREIDVAKASGWKILIVAVLVLTGTYVGSALIAHVML